MNRTERFNATIKHQPVDRVPMYDFLFQQPLFEVLIGRKPVSYNARDAVACALALDHDLVWVPFGGARDFQPRYLKPDVYIDEWGTTFEHNFSAWPIDAPIDYPIRDRSDLRGFHPPDPTAPGRLDEIQAALGMDRDGLVISGSVGGPFTQAWMLMGYERICFTLYEDPQLLHDLFRISTDFSLEAVRLQAQAGVSAIWISDDFGDSVRGFLKPRQFSEYVLPHIAELAEAIAGHGLPVLLHSCGHIREYLPGLAQTKINAVHPMQRTAGMDLRWMKENYGERFCLIGNIDSSRTLPFGIPDDVRAEVREAIEIAAPGSGYILASDHSLHDGISVENIVALFDEGEKYSREFFAKSIKS
jgi:uroporphyrinogen decarboxylase